jgi:hypothetical protein
MQFARRSLLALIAALFSALLILTAIDFGILGVVGSPVPVKKILSESGIYNSVVSSALDQAKKSSSGGSEVSLMDPLVKKAAEDSFNPQVVQSSTEKVIDGIYNWLDGKSAQPDFNVDLSSVKADFAEKAASAAKFHADSLPICTTVPTTTDPFSATCLPRGVTSVQVGEQAKNDVLNGQGFLDNPTLTADSVKNPDTGQSVFDNKLKDAPKRYQTFKKAPFVLAILTLLAAIAIIFLSQTKRRGVRRVGITLTIIGGLLFFFAWAFSKGVEKQVIPMIKLDNSVLQLSVRRLASDAVHQIAHNYLIFGGVYLALGVLAIIVSMLIGRNKKTPEAAQEKTPAPSSASKPASKPAQKPKTSPRIQG